MADSPQSRSPGIRQVLGSLELRLGQASALVDEDEARLLACAPTVSAWSTAQHLFHLTLACDLSLGNVTSLVAQRGRRIREPIERHEEGLAYLAAGALPRGRVEAPRFVQPPARIDLGLLRELLDDALETQRTLARDPDAIERAPRAIPHQLLGDLSAAEWIRFAEVHTGHHLTILGEIRAALAARGS